MGPAWPCRLGDHRRRPFGLRRSNKTMASVLYSADRGHGTQWRLELIRGQGVHPVDSIWASWESVGKRRRSGRERRHVGPRPRALHLHRSWPYHGAIIMYGSRLPAWSFLLPVRAERMDSGRNTPVLWNTVEH